MHEACGRLPSNMRIGTYDDHPLLDFASVRIHSVRQDYAAIAGKAFQILIQKLRGNNSVTRETVSAQLLVRN